MKVGKRVRLSDLKNISQEEFDRAAQLCGQISSIWHNRPAYIEQHGVDPEIGFPAANWQQESNDFVSAYRFVAESPNYDVINRLRFYTQFFTGYNLRALAFTVGSRTVVDIPDNLDEILDSTVPEPDFWVYRYIDIIQKVPPFLRVEVPKMLGEIGWDVEGITASHDLCVYQERLTALYDAGVIHELQQKVQTTGTVTILEIGGGYGGLARLIKQVIPQANYIICDLPESLLFSSIYLGLTSPTYPHTIYDGNNLDAVLKDDSGFKFVPNFMFDSLVEAAPAVDLAINTLSFSEMSEKQVRHYAAQLKALLGNTGILFEQNQDNRKIGLIYCKDYLPDYFENRETVYPVSIPGGLTQGVADLWSNREDKLQQKWLIAQLHHNQAMINQLQSELSETQAQLQKKGARIAKQKQKIKHLEQHLNDTENVIAAMETSKFWKLRQLWFAVKKSLFSR